MVGSTKPSLVHRDDHDHHHHHHHLMADDDHPENGGGDDGHRQQHNPSPSLVPCSICFDLVSDNGARSRAKLQCGHEFHLDCIGSAFNAKGAMQCPNCRKVEKGQWLYANGSARSYHDLSMDDWFPFEDFYDTNYPEMPFAVHWCPFGQLAQVGSAFEEIEAPSTTYQDVRGHHSLYAERPSSVARSYVAYVGPFPPTLSRLNDTFDDPNFNHMWSGPPGHNEIFNPHTLSAINIQYHGWRHLSPPFSVSSGHTNGPDPASVPALTSQSSSAQSEARMRPTTHPHPLLFGHRSGPTSSGQFVSAIIPRHSGNNGQTLERIQSHAFHPPLQSSTSSGLPSSLIHGFRRFDGPRGLPAMVPAPPQHDHGGGFIIPPSISLGQNLHEIESHLPSHFLASERGRLSHPPHPSFGRDSGWASFYQNPVHSDPGNRSSTFGHR